MSINSPEQMQEIVNQFSSLFNATDGFMSVEDAEKLSAIFAKIVDSHIEELKSSGLRKAMLDMKLLDLNGVYEELDMINKKIESSPPGDISGAILGDFDKLINTLSNSFSE